MFRQQQHFKERSYLYVLRTRQKSCEASHRALTTIKQDHSMNKINKCSHPIPTKNLDHTHQGINKYLICQRQYRKEILRLYVLRTRQKFCEESHQALTTINQDYSRNKLRNVHTPSSPKIFITTIENILICHSFSIRIKLTQNPNISIPTK